LYRPIAPEAQEKVRLQSYAHDCEERLVSLFSIAAPIFAEPKSC
jgi:DNA-binding IclR family transcriptional regulator